MIPILRYYHESQGLLQVDDLKGYIFTSESFAHEFTVARLLYDPDTGQEIETPFAGVSVTARFRRADGVPVVLTGELVRGRAVVKLSPECYQVPGAFDFFIFVTTDGVAQCVYTARASVLSAEGEGAVLAPSARKSIEEQIHDIIADLDADVKSANLVAVFARNIGDVEEAVATFQASVDGIVRALAEANVRALNGPNLLPNQPDGVQVAVASGPVVLKYASIPAEDAEAAAQPLTFTFEDEAIVSGMVLHYVRSSNYSIVTRDMVSAVVGNGTATVTIAARAGAHEAATAVDLVFCAQTTATVPYGEQAAHYASGYPWLNSTSNIYPGVESDEISERLVTLTGDAIITDSDGVSYDRAVAFTVANAPTQGGDNCDMLVFNYGTDGGTRADGSTYGPYGQLPMEDGGTYTLSCYARITAGTDARIVLAYGMDSSGYFSTGYAGNHKYIDIKNTAWERISFTFVYHAAASYEAQGANPYTVQVTHKPRVGAGVCRRFNGTVQLAGFRLVHGGLFGSNTVDTLEAHLQDLAARVEALERQNTAGTQSTSGETE